MKKILVIVASVVLIYVLFATKTRWVVRDVGSGEIAWRADDCFVIVSVSHFGWKLSAWDVVHEFIKALLRIPSTRLSETSRDSDVFHYVNGRMFKVSVKGLDAVAGITPYEGRLYLFVGGEPVRGWIWTGALFAEVNQVEVKRVQDAIAATGLDYEQQLHKEGWKRIPVFTVVNEPRKEYSIRLSHDELKIVVLKPTDSETVITYSDARAEETLETFDRSISRVSKT